MIKTIDHNEWIDKVKSCSHFSAFEILQGVAAGYPAISEFTFQYEGGYVNDPDDPGGCTNMGITIGTLRAWRDDPSVNCEDVKALTKFEAQMIYAANYWSPVWGNKLPIGLNAQVYDWGVNSGPSRSVKYLQQMVDSPADGVMGPNTLKAAEAFVAKEGIDIALHEYHETRQAYYESLSSFDKYGNGWTSRNDACLELSLNLAHDRTPTIPWPDDLLDLDNDTDILKRITRLEMWADSFHIAQKG